MTTQKEFIEWTVPTDHPIPWLRGRTLRKGEIRHANTDHPEVWFPGVLQNKTGMSFSVSELASSSSSSSRVYLEGVD